MTEDIDWVRFPKVDLHRHLEGSLRLSTLEEIAASSDHDSTVGNLEKLKSLLRPGPSGRNPEDFLAKFPIIRGFFLSPEIIARVAYEAVADAAADGLRYLELRFNPVALAEHRGLTLGLAADSVISGVRRAESDFDILVRLLVTVNRAESKNAGHLMQIAAERLSKGVVGIDLAGDEVHIPADPYIDLFARANEMGLGTTVHAGEWAGAENVRFAIEVLKADRIGHGIRIIEDEVVLDLARCRNTLFEVCVTSNLQTGAVESIARHPIRKMIREGGLQVTLNTDDPSLAGVTLSGELALVHDALGFTIEEIKKMTRTAARSAFLDDVSRANLLSRLETDFGGIVL